MSAIDTVSGITAPGPLTVRPVDVLLSRIHSGQPHRGVGRGADVLMDRGLNALLHSLGWPPRSAQAITERGLAGLPGGLAIAEALEVLASSIAASLASGGFPLTLGGDHAIAFGSLEGALRANPETRILYVDAHADINTPAISPSGNTHGMPVAAHLGLFDPAQLAESTCVGARLKPEQIAFIGLRDVDPGEWEILDRFGIAHFSTTDMRALGPEATLRRALDAIDPQGRYPLHVSFDIDVMDPTLAPATGVPVPDGFSEADMRHLARALHATGRVASLDVVEVNPDLSGSRAELERTADLALGFIAGVLTGAMTRPNAAAAE